MKLAIIGAGNMASALAGGILENGVLPAIDMTMTDLDKEKLSSFAQRGVNTMTSNVDAAKSADVVLLAVKPNIYPIVLKELAALEEKPCDKEKRIYVTIAPGITIRQVKEMLGYDAKVIRTMPNTPAMVGEGMTALCYEAPVSGTEYKNVEKLFRAVGRVQLLDEKLLNSVIGISGSSPAYVYMMIEAMADAGVRDGLPRTVAYQMAAQSVLGTAKMVLETGRHPAELKDMVCSPGGTTIEAVRVLEEKGFRSSLIEAMIACNKRAEKK
jgi:pyrroline-5-carboxylate reductase